MKTLDHPALDVALFDEGAASLPWMGVRWAVLDAALTVYRRAPKAERRRLFRTMRRWSKRMEAWAPIGEVEILGLAAALKCRIEIHFIPLSEAS